MHLSYRTDRQRESQPNAAKCFTLVTIISESNKAKSGAERKNKVKWVVKAQLQGENEAIRPTHTHTYDIISFIKNNKKPVGR